MKKLLNQIPEIMPKPHPLKALIKRKKISLWKLRRALGGSPSEFKLSRVLNGVESIHPELEKRIRQACLLL
jgi:hypothetical protein